MSLAVRLRLGLAAVVALLGVATQAERAGVAPDLVPDALVQGEGPVRPDGPAALTTATARRAPAAPRSPRAFTLPAAPPQLLPTVRRLTHYVAPLLPPRSPRATPSSQRDPPAGRA